MPSSQFEKLPVQVKDRIVGASLAEFAASGYDAASTNRIVAAAGISKGVLFKYFDDKERLFLYVADVSLRSYLAGLPDGSRLNLVDWIRASTRYKLRYMRESPLAYQLFMRVMRDPGHPVYAKVVAAQAAQVRAVGREMAGWAEDPQIRPGVTPAHIANLLGWIGMGLQEKFMAVLPDTVDDKLESAFQTVLEEFDVYFDIVRLGIYRNGGE